MIDSVERVLEVFAQAGIDIEEDPPPAAQVLEADLLLARAAADPASVVAEVFRQRRLADSAKRECAKAAEAAGHLEDILRGLLGASPLLCRLERLQRRAGAPARALCRVAGELRDLPVHPDVALNDLEQLAPWHFVCVHPTEWVVIGACNDPELAARAHGEVVEWVAWHDRERGLARVAREGSRESVVELAACLRERAFDARSRLVLHRDDARWAIAVVPAERSESRFEVSIDSITARLDDLAGLDDVIDRLLEELLLCLVNPELRARFDLRPLHGLLLYSYKPGMGKTALVRAVAVWLRELGRELAFDVALYVVKPNELKSMWHGGDARLVREELCGCLAARRDAPRKRPLFQLVVLDEIDSLGKRSGGDDRSQPTSSAHNDAVQSLLAEIDGLVQETHDSSQPPAHVLWVGLTNRPDMLDEALKRPGRFGDIVLEMPAPTAEGAEAILAVYARSQSLPWFCDGEIRSALSIDETRERFLRPALARVLDAIVLRYATDHQAGVAVRACDVMASVHLVEALNSAKKRAAKRGLHGVGIPAVRLEDLVESLLEQACSAARQMHADRTMLARQLRLETRVTRVELVPMEELSSHRYVNGPTTGS